MKISLIMCIIKAFNRFECNKKKIKIKNTFANFIYNCLLVKEF